MIACWYPVGRFRGSTIANLERPGAIAAQTPQLPWLPLLRLGRLVRSATNESQQRQPAANETHLALGEALHQTDQEGWPGHALRGGAVLARSRPRYGHVPRLKAPNEASGEMCRPMVYPKTASRSSSSDWDGVPQFGSYPTISRSVSAVQRSSSTSIISAVTFAGWVTPHAQLKRSSSNRIPAR